MEDCTCNGKHAAQHGAHPDQEVRQAAPGVRHRHRQRKQVVDEEHCRHLPPTLRYLRVVFCRWKASAVTQTRCAMRNCMASRHFFNAI